MRPYCSGSPSTGCPAGSRDARVRISGSMLRPRDMCSTTKTAACKSRENSATTEEMASTPPAEAPIRTISCLATESSLTASYVLPHLACAEIGVAGDIPRRTRVVRFHSLAFGSKTERQGDPKGLQCAHLTVEPGVGAGTLRIRPAEPGA